MIRRLIGFILSVIVAIILFILLVAFFPSRKKSVDIVNMSYIFVDNDWIEYDIFEPVHWAAVDWSFLFKNDKESNWNTGDKGNVLGNIDYVWEMEIDTWVDSQVTNLWETHELPGLDSENPYNLPEWAVEKPYSWDSLIDDPNNPIYLPEWAVEKPVYKDCNTPRWVIIKHKESILAYQQREDVPDICNVQRRTCYNGVLDWSFTQPSCNETVVYSNWTTSSKNRSSESSNTVSYTKKQVIAYNDTSVKSELIQTPKYTKNELAEYDKNWKIKRWAEQPKTDWNNNDKWWVVTDYDSVEQINVKNYNCQTPWWEIVQHWQFVRAYEFPFWFTNASCRVELRLCVDGELKWSYWYQECQYLDITYEEYNNRVDASRDALIQEALQHESAEKERHWFWWWIKNLFN